MTHARAFLNWCSSSGGTKMTSPASKASTSSPPWTVPEPSRMNASGARAGEKTRMSYRVYRFDIKMTRDQDRLEQFLNKLEGEIVAIIPNVTPMPATYVDFLLIVEKVA